MAKLNDPFIHVVYFWLKEPQNHQHRNQFEASINRFLNDSQYAGWWHVGTPAGTDRPVADNSFTYCLVVTFPTSAQHDLYQAEPAHRSFIDEAGVLWERVLVYDSITSKDGFTTG